MKDVLCWLSKPHLCRWYRLQVWPSLSAKLHEHEARPLQKECCASRAGT
jgi:hypothetical protein